MVLAMWMGAPLVPSKSKTGIRMIELLQLKKGQTLYDLGSGDGRLLLLAAQKGAKAYGVEINPYALLWSWLRVVLSGKKKNISLHWRNYWWINLKTADAVVVYAMPGFMPRLSKKLKKELRPGTLVVSNSFSIPRLKLIKEEIIGKDRIFLYRI